MPSAFFAGLAAHNGGTELSMKNYRLYLIRHGVTAGNLAGIYTGSGTDEPLCPEGKAQLQALKDSFAYPQVKTVFSSPLQRAIDSAEVLFPTATQKIVLQDLRENHFGEFEGRAIQELVQDEHFKQWLNPSAHYTPEGGESAHAFHARCREVIMQMFEYMMKSGLEQAACVTHGGVIMSMLAQRGMPKQEPEKWMADAGCGYVLHCSAEMWMRDGIVEAVDILPFGYLDGKQAK